MSIPSREREVLEAKARDAERDADMYAKGWERELGPWMAPKSHHIDACVVGTRNLVASQREHAAYAAAVKEWRQDTILARTLGLSDPDLMTYLPSPSNPQQGEER